MMEIVPLTISEAEFDDLPFGVIQINAGGTVLRYNTFESRLSHLAAEYVIGKNFFAEIAPCTKVANFYGRFEKARALGVVDEQFEFVFPFPHGHREVIIHIMSGLQDTYWICIADRTANSSIRAQMKEFLGAKGVSPN